ncbi:hypothetical protein pEaSNUABM14_00057 [Erwinia phage pEa_SNUABM_14]|uniref:Uncharacterized protein n=1 Tax=Erwinia phage pEa_SNUABM_7 TaxID=2866695 RepID=A0AAE7WS97_9CAUD|nr:hypothetical protein MPK74_gp058 [Erwinia phage pEa_SNUABM_7]QYW03359.1 hypothetical protein pEaSNUABM34_00057 [Erwinia phage pEa_SNUABM_34]QYW03700.1 hypothetical protein pEaSNUABM45_00057 [Erwinia phage pEa_SNUABM_45]QYW04041.1 hypothetical protein pEaSNUABM46_00057 [Erwinia phage pEa_SNUABM_46]QYW04382.1 hypothetical protein pEaSNUABM14_00057 [Erwinia phage pEa_SNUABM_14]QYW05072.1 hypothetical protein pEaSNUABM21_00058 [Erwinia phage pEa_SNUABM_21]
MKDYVMKRLAEDNIDPENKDMIMSRIRDIMGGVLRAQPTLPHMFGALEHSRVPSLFDAMVVCDHTNNSEEDIANNILNVSILPRTPVQQIYFNIDPGSKEDASFISKTVKVSKSEQQ